MGGGGEEESEPRSIFTHLHFPPSWLIACVQPAPLPFPRLFSSPEPFLCPRCHPRCAPQQTPRRPFPDIRSRCPGQAQARGHPRPLKIRQRTHPRQVHGRTRGYIPFLSLCTRVNSPVVVGTLKGYDQLLNLVLDDVEEQIQGNATALPFLIILTSCYRTRTPYAFSRPCSPSRAPYHHR